MDYNAVVKIFGEVVNGLSPEFREKHFVKIGGCVILLVTVPAVTGCVKHCVNMKTKRDCYIAAIENGLITKESLTSAEPFLIDLPATT